MTKPSNDYVQFRLLEMSCCHILICWVNPRRPNFCPECGKRVFSDYPKEQWEAQYSEAWLRVTDYEKATWK
jgi:hypothetical protein